MATNRLPGPALRESWVTVAISTAPVPPRTAPGIRAASSASFTAGLPRPGGPGVSRDRFSTHVVPASSPCRGRGTGSPPAAADELQPTSPGGRPPAPPRGRRGPAGPASAPARLGIGSSRDEGRGGGRRVRAIGGPDHRGRSAATRSTRSRSSGGNREPAQRRLGDPREEGRRHVAALVPGPRGLSRETSTTSAGREAARSPEGGHVVTMEYRPLASIFCAVPVFPATT